MNKEKRIFNPSFEYERKTSAFNSMLWGFVFLISMFTIEIVIILNLASVSIFSLVASFLSEHIYIITSIPVALCLIFAYQIVVFMVNLKRSYKFERNTIIRGSIVNPDSVKGIDVAISAAVTAMMFRNIKNSNTFFAISTFSDLSTAIALIKLNVKPDFVNQYFDTDLYRKEVFTNPKLVKETKYSLVYKCNNKKLVIPKIYEGFNSKSVAADLNNSTESKQNVKSNSLVGRIFKRCAIVFMITLILSIVDLIVSANNNPVNLENVQQTITKMNQNFSSYGYELSKQNETCYTFNKSLDKGGYTSSVKYIFNKKGEITDVYMDVYYDDPINSSKELSFILKSLDSNLTDAQIHSFISQVNSSISGSHSYPRFAVGKNKITVGPSNGFIQVHN